MLAIGVDLDVDAAKVWINYIGYSEEQKDSHLRGSDDQEASQIICERTRSEPLGSMEGSSKNEFYKYLRKEYNSLPSVVLRNLTGTRAGIHNLWSADTTK